MASLNSTESSPPNLSFAMRDPTKKTTSSSSSSQRFYRSISTKEASNFSQFSFTPPRLSCPSLPQSFHNSPESSPLHPAFGDHLISYRCVSSVLKKDGQILSAAIFDDIVYTGSDGNLIRVWKLPEFTESGELKTKASMVVALEVSHDKVYGAYGDCKIRVWRRAWDRGLKHFRLATVPTTGSYVRSYFTGKEKMTRHMGPITSLAINISDDLLYSSSLDKSIKVWRLSDFKCIETILQAHSSPINALISSAAGLLYSASDDATIRLWRRNFLHTSPHSLLTTLPANLSPVKTLTLSPNGAVLYAGCSDGYVRFWFSGQFQYGGVLKGHTHAVMSLAVAGDFFVSGSADCTCRVWEAVEGRHVCLAVLVGHRGPVRSLAAVCGSMEEDCVVCSGSLDGVLKVWRVTRKNNAGNSSFD